jgi:hypothetical protein
MRNGRKGTVFYVYVCENMYVYMDCAFKVRLLLPQPGARRLTGGCGQAYVVVLEDSRERVMVKFGSWARG